jgi:hypothetical protein
MAGKNRRAQGVSGQPRAGRREAGLSDVRAIDGSVQRPKWPRGRQRRSRRARQERGEMIIC